MYYDTLLSWLMSIAGARELMEQVLLKPDITPKFCITVQVPSTNVAVAVILVVRTVIRLSVTIL